MPNERSTESRGAEGCEQDDAPAAEQLWARGWEQREQELRERSLKLTRQHWVEIVAVADELLRLQSLDDTEVEFVCDATAGDPEDSTGDHWQGNPSVETSRLKEVTETDSGWLGIKRDSLCCVGC
jgi:hypothetical protein